jgi:DNA-binding NarL/FixJ family response regulator
MPERSQPVRILIADDHTLFRDGLCALLGSIPDTEVVGEASTGMEVRDQAATFAPDVVLMDIQMPDMNGIEATRRILQENPEIGVIVLTMFEDDDSVFAAMRAGARGYILKGAGQAEMLRAIRAVASGEALFGPAIADRLIAFFGAKPLTPR